MDVQTVAFRSPTTQGLPGPFPATVYAVLLTPWGTPAMPPVSMRLLQGSNGYAHFYNLEPGQYRVWMDVPVGWNPIPGTGPSQYLWIQPNGPNCQALFQYQACSYCPNGGPGGLPPVPPGPIYTGVPTFTVCGVAQNGSVTIKTANFPPNQTFTVTMGAFGTQGIGGVVVGTINSGTGGTLTATFGIPAQFAGYNRLALRAQTAHAYPFFAYNWFFNTTATVC